MIKSNFHFVRRTVLRGAVLLIPILVLVAGCSTNLDPSGALLVRTPEPAQADPILTFVGSAPVAGQTGRVERPGEAASVRVRVERVYESASGHQCRRYHLSSSEGVPTLSSYLACRGAEGNWFQSRLLVNPDSLDASGSSALRAGGS